MLSSVQCRQVCVIRDITLAKSERITAGVCVCVSVRYRILPHHVSHLFSS